MTKINKKIAIVGSRKYKNLDFVEKYVKNNMKKGDILVSGGAKGVDITAENAAKKMGIETKIFYPDWNNHGKGAGFIRNTDIVENCDEIICFWDGSSRGAMDSMKKAKKMNKQYKIFGPDGEVLR